MSYWLVQAVPRRFDPIAERDAGREIEKWSIARHVRDVAAGDPVALWIGGQDAPGVYAIGEVTGEPFEDVADDTWKLEEDQGQLKTFCPIHLDWLDVPIAREELRADPRFASARILSQPQAGNPFRMVESEWEAITSRLAQPRGPRRNPNWADDELMLALDVYLRHGLLDDQSGEVQDLSDLLNRLPIHPVRPDGERFRNPNGVALKLANFAALDPNYPGVGMTRGGKRDAALWHRYSNKPEELHQLAQRIRAGVTEGQLPDVPEEGEEDVEEGRLLYRQHRVRERSRALVTRKKEQAARSGPLVCEVCGFDFEETYGQRGAGYIECHHVVPLSMAEPGKTRLSDLALLCANCHRMVHRGSPWPSPAGLRATLGK